jgi:hypothetical protein
VKQDPNVKIHRNEGPKRLGHTILYDTLINDYATNDIVMIYHADMYALPGLDDEVNKYIGDGKVISLTRIEPPLHPPGPEKILEDYGIEPEEFNEQKLLNEYKSFKRDSTTEGIFAPWAIMKKDFQSIGGHDSLYAPQSKEDSDIFNRFLLAGYQLIQTWDGFVYHMTCRGSRFADGAWCSNIYGEYPKYMREQFVHAEQPDTMYDLDERVKRFHSEKNNDILVEFDINKFTNQSFQYIQQLSEILTNNDLEVGEFELDIFKITVINIKTYERDLIKCER